MASSYAKGTEVSVGRTKEELERILRNRGASGFMVGWEDGNEYHVIAFKLAERLMRLQVPRSWPDDHKRTPTGLVRTDTAARKEAEAEERRRWRSLLLVVKARLVAVDDGVETLEAAFLPWIVLPGGQTIAEWIGPQLDVAYATNEMPALIPGAPPLALESGRR